LGVMYGWTFIFFGLWQDSNGAEKVIHELDILLIVWRNNSINAVLVKTSGEQVVSKNLLINKAAIDDTAQNSKKGVSQLFEKMFVFNITCGLVMTTLVVEETKLSELFMKGIRRSELIRESKKTGGTPPPGVSIRSDTV
jgi:hypothetical protein